MWMIYYEEYSLLIFGFKWLYLSEGSFLDYMLEELNVLMQDCSNSIAAHCT